MTGPLPVEEKRKRAPARSEAIDGVRRAPVRRTRTTSSGESPTKRPARRMVAPVAEADEVGDERVSTGEVRRKAPTPVAGEQAVRRERKHQRIVAGTVLFLGIGASAALGFYDKGQIDVNQTIEERNERVRTNNTDERDVSTVLVEVPVVNSENAGKADGGLVGLGEASSPTPIPPPVASSTASTTDQTASSTDATATTTESGAAETTQNASSGDSENTESPSDAEDSL